MRLERKWAEEFTTERFHQLLGVDPDKLQAFKSLNPRAIQPAVTGVNFLCDFGCSVEPITSGRKVIKVKLSWWKKNLDEIKAAYRDYSGQGRPKGTPQRHCREDRAAGNIRPL